MTIDVNGDYAVDAGQAAAFDLPSDGTAAYALESSARLTVLGAVTIGASAAGVGAYGVVAEDIDAALHIGAGGSLTLSATGAGSSGYGFYAGADQASFANDGTFSVSAAWGPAAVTFTGSGTFANAGVVTVSGLDGFATGVFSGGAIQGGNSGGFTISGPLDTEAFRLVGGGAFTNSGAITAASAGHASYGIVGDDASGGAIAITNTATGTIAADTAISDDGLAGRVVLVNGGTIDGDIALGNGAGGLANWVFALGHGESRAQVVVGFSESAEHVDALAPHVDSGIWLAS